MPGYVIHLAEAELILDKMRKLRQTDDAFEQAFLTGTLLPDTRLKGEKQFFHISWDPDKLDVWHWDRIWPVLQINTDTAE